MNDKLIHPPFFNTLCAIERLSQLSLGEKNMSIEIKAERKRIYKITEINMLSQVDLPSEYLARAPHVYKTKNGKGIVLRYFDSKTKTVNAMFVDVGDEFTEHKLAFIEKMIRASGQRLHDINHKNDTKETENKHNESVEWSGIYLVEV